MNKTVVNMSIVSVVLNNNIQTMKFPIKLWKIINECNTGAIRWSDKGKSILIDYIIFQDEYLGCCKSLFKTRNITSFVRQLNLYGFRKVTSHYRDPSCNLQNPNIHEFLHSYFQFGRPDLLINVFRKTLNQTKLNRKDRIRQLTSDKENILPILKPFVMYSSNETPKTTLNEVFDPMENIIDPLMIIKKEMTDKVTMIKQETSFCQLNKQPSQRLLDARNALRVALEKVSDQMKNKTLANEDNMLMDIMTIQNGNNENEDVPELSLLELQPDEMWDDRTSLASGDDFTFQLPTIYRDMEGWIAEDLMFSESANGDLSLPPVAGAPDIQLMELQTQIKELSDEQESAAVSVQQLLDYMASMAPGDKVRHLLDPK
uniref:HSF-type DNA-binding domain-containing protein n=1 Tax=Timema cristinae TaxID=61476 RepID=A0A7R9DA71_TIMCR|nr:unnamed protein product [Timema cristinae]